MNLEGLKVSCLAVGSTLASSEPSGVMAVAPMVGVCSIWRGCVTGTFRHGQLATLSFFAKSLTFFYSLSCVSTNLPSRTTPGVTSLFIVGSSAAIISYKGDVASTANVGGRV